MTGVLKKMKREQFERVPEPDINFAQKMSLLKKVSLVITLIL